MFLAVVVIAVGKLGGWVVLFSSQAGQVQLGLLYYYIAIVGLGVMLLLLRLHRCICHNNLHDCLLMCQ